MLTSKKMIIDINRLDYYENDNEVIISILKQYLPQIQALEENNKSIKSMFDSVYDSAYQLRKQQAELVEALINVCGEFHGFLDNEYNGSILDQCPEIIALIEKILNKKWEEIR
jgi:hypothetical protein